MRIAAVKIEISEFRLWNEENAWQLQCSFTEVRKTVDKKCARLSRCVAHFGQWSQFQRLFGNSSSPRLTKRPFLATRTLNHHLPCRWTVNQMGKQEVMSEFDCFYWLHLIWLRFVWNAANCKETTNSVQHLNSFSLGRPEPTGEYVTLTILVR